MVGIDLGGIFSCELVRTAQCLLFDPGQHIGCAQGAAHVLEHDAVDVGMACDDTSAYRRPAVLMRSAPVRAGVYLHY